MSDKEMAVNIPCGTCQESVRLKVCKYLEDQGGIGAIEESCDPVDFILASHSTAIHERNEAINILRVLNEETVLAGYPGGDRNQTLSNVRAMKEKNIALGDADYVLNVDRTWKAKKKEISDLKDALNEAMSEISEYKRAQILQTKHTTPLEKMKKWLQLVK